MNARRKALHAAEVAYLLESGWELSGKDEWRSPHSSRRDRVYDHDHAVNSQKWFEANAKRLGIPLATKRVEPEERPTPLSVRARMKRDGLTHPLQDLMERPGRPFEPPTTPNNDGQLKHHLESVRHHFASRHVHPHHLESLRSHIRWIRKGWRPRVGRGCGPI